MDRYKAYFEGKKVTVMGLGLLGRGIGDAAALAECGAEVIVTDMKSEAELATSVAALKDFSNITFVLGEHRLEDFEKRDLVLVAAGVPMDSEYVAHARKAGVRLAQSAALFVELSKIPVIGVTGTRGKSTVTHMIHHVLEVTTGEKVLLGGNVRGVSNLQLLKEVHEDSLAVMELDSWQLQGFGWDEVSPQIAVFTNLMPDHLNYYNGDMRAYFRDKANIFLYQEPSGTLIIIPELLPQIEAYAKEKGIELQQEIILADSSVLPEDCLLALPGEHNRLNAALAHRALIATGLTDEEIFEGLASFPGLPGRLQYLGSVEGVKIYNDNNATTPAATIAALRALGEEEKKNVVLIMGGSDKGIEMDELGTEIALRVKHTILLPGTGTDRIRASLPEAVSVTSMAEAVEKARERAETGDTIVLSPAFASFGLFKNEYERGDAFVDIINTLL
ncbi:UDP-N-acetylmuramoyl-L-alanine--D-glutamate ligase [Candidatus Kaiserbacteria bacterium CG10_big_fil_rev_8_21_14_0_10_47_16]|uniref:UDP-N-acetylmuramoylalanine--D-glutamate ligase n=1 Tax=Candidatus Kaiserbacteria bacterium CG10_big_fil_rev_8_21_14_0_10_47_16 TaxID=1974608 RepID=A0A2H0UEP3_9BACT|nr:MAG: UDP-N-acetylmuramoyl-L-alanine--D-glutamate ligase [Candidatus Kaiserbacteria bacterium CG10_big_fil_rev_8_21_14_0_10_47_16]